jgi:hypothetical protein
MTSLGDWILRANNLRYLDLSRNKLLCDGLKTLVKTIDAENTSLEFLDLSFCQLKDSGLRILAEHLATPECKIQGVSAKRNFISDHGFKKFLDILSQGKNLSLNFISLKNNEFTDLKLVEHAKKCEKVGIYSDVLGKLSLLEPELLERSVYFQVPAVYNSGILRQVTQFLKANGVPTVINTRMRAVKQKNRHLYISSTYAQKGERLKERREILLNQYNNSKHPGNKPNPHNNRKVAYSNRN